ncbi:MAG: ECF-type sigma factor [Planctomycetota bacterium]|jgi:RNA polymerase sigma factor (TIGR02999 family)
MVAVGDITLLLREVEAGRRGALDELMVMVYADLENMARAYLRKHFGNRAEAITLEPASLVNESFLKLIKQRKTYDNSGHFFTIASRVMLRVLIDYRRRRDATRRGGRRTRITLVLDEHQVASREPRTPALEVEQLADALEKLEALSPRKADTVKMRVIWGLDLKQTAEALDVSIATVSRDWRFAKAWLSEAVGPASREA